MRALEVGLSVMDTWPESEYAELGLDFLSGTHSGSVPSDLRWIRVAIHLERVVERDDVERQYHGVKECSLWNAKKKAGCAYILRMAM